MEELSQLVLNVTFKIKHLAAYRDARLPGLRQLEELIFAMDPPCSDENAFTEHEFLAWFNTTILLSAEAAAAQ